MEKEQNTPFIESSLAKVDQQYEIPLRPQTLGEFCGQEKVQKRLNVMIQASLERNEALSHCLLYGPPGLGKTTLSHIIAKAMQSNLVITSGPVLEKAGDLAGLLTNLKKGDILFIDEIHRLNKTIEEYLYSAMEDFSIDLMIDSGPSARSVQIQIAPFTLIGATTRIGLLTSPLRSRFTFTARLDYYPASQLETILLRSANLMNIAMSVDAAKEIAKRSRGTPRIANNLLRWVRDYAQVNSNNKIDKKSAEEALHMLSIDQIGLDEVDKKILSIIIDHHEGGPVGLKTLAVAIGEEAETLSEVYEPYLIMQGLVKRTQRGREATTKAYQHLGRTQPKKQICGDLL